MAVIGQHRPPTVPATWHRGSRGGLARGRRPAHPRARFRHRKRRAGRSGLAHVTWRRLTDRTDLRVVQRACRELAHRRQGGSALRPPGADPRISAPDRRLRRSAWHGHHSAFFCLARAHRHSRGGCTRDWSSGPSRVAYRASRTPRSPTPSWVSGAPYGTSAGQALSSQPFDRYDQPTRRSTHALLRVGCSFESCRSTSVALRICVVTWGFLAIEQRSTGWVGASLGASMRPERSALGVRSTTPAGTAEWASRRGPACSTRPTMPGKPE
jgi:hypothetical protein